MISLAFTLGVLFGMTVPIAAFYVLQTAKARAEDRRGVLWRVGEIVDGEGAGQRAGGCKGALLDDAGVRRALPER